MADLTNQERRERFRTIFLGQGVDLYDQLMTWAEDFARARGERTEDVLADVRQLWAERTTRRSS